MIASSRQENGTNVYTHTYTHTYTHAHFLCSHANISQVAVLFSHDRVFAKVARQENGTNMCSYIHTHTNIHTYMRLCQRKWYEYVYIHTYIHASLPR